MLLSYLLSIQYWGSVSTVLPYSDVWHATDLWISLLGVVPQQDCQPRPIVDNTFSGVNKATIKIDPPESIQIGKGLDRIIQKAVDADPQHGTVSLSKYNLANAFIIWELACHLQWNLNLQQLFLLHWQMKTPLLQSPWCYLWDGWSHPGILYEGSQRP